MGTYCLFQEETLSLHGLPGTGTALRHGCMCANSSRGYQMQKLSHTTPGLKEH